MERPPAKGGEQLAKFTARWDSVLATIVLAVDPSFMYVIGPNSTEQDTVWKALMNQFQCKMWVNKLDLK